MRPLRLVTFDMTGTLLNFRAPVMQQYAAVAAKYGVTAKPEELQKNFKKSWKSMSENHQNFGKASGLGWHSWWRSIVHQTFDQNCDKSVMDAVAADLIRHFETDRAWCVADGGIELLRTLKDQKIPLGVISNFDPRLHTIIQNLNMSHYFSFVLTSYEAGFLKPDARIFQKAAKQANVSYLVHIGNDRRLDFDAARAAGFDAVLIDREHQETDLKFPERAKSLQDVNGCLEKLTGK